MTPNIEAFQELFKFTGALSVLAGAMAWWRRDSDDERDMIIAAADTVLDGISDADSVRKIDCLTDKNLRDQITVEEAQNIHEEREGHRWGFRRN